MIVLELNPELGYGFPRMKNTLHKIFGLKMKIALKILTCCGSCYTSHVNFSCYTNKVSMKGVNRS